jgi:hypothetical protein
LEANDGRRCAVAKAGDGDNQAERANSDSGNLHENVQVRSIAIDVARLVLRCFDQTRIPGKNQEISPWILT